MQLGTSGMDAAHLAISFLQDKHLGSSAENDAACLWSETLFVAKKEKGRHHAVPAFGRMLEQNLCP